jgi:hypothetical protein
MRCAHFPIRLRADLDRVPDEAVAPVAAAPTKNIENNPMQSSRRSPATDGSDRKLDTSGKSAASFHHPKIR